MAFSIGVGELCVSSKDDSADGAQADGELATELKISSTDFESYLLPEDGGRDGAGDDESTIALTIKPAKAMVRFCDGADVGEIKFYFSVAGRPVALVARAANGCDCRFVISSTRVKRAQAAAPPPPRADHRAPAAPAGRALPEAVHGKRKHPREAPPATLSQDSDRSAARVRREGEGGSMAF